jgi:chromosomal replication initiation ATPase DnaA
MNQLISPYAIPCIPRLDTPENIFQTVCDLYKISPKKVMENVKSRKRPFPEIRQITMSLIKNKLDYSYKMTADFFFKDHVTAMYAEKTINNLRETDKVFFRKTNFLFR